MIDSHEQHLFPVLTPAQIERVAAHGHRRTTARGDVLVETGDSTVPFFLVVSGTIQALRVGDDEIERPIVELQAGQFSGEATMITGRRALSRLRVNQPGE